jgi:hypothetical protein
MDDHLWRELSARIAAQGVLQEGQPLLERGQERLFLCGGMTVSDTRDPDQPRRRLTTDSSYLFLDEVQDDVLPREKIGIGLAHLCDHELAHVRQQAFESKPQREREREVSSTSREESQIRSDANLGACWGRGCWRNGPPCE